MAILIRTGDAADFDAAVAVFKRSNLARREGVWPHRPASVARVRECLSEPAARLWVAEEGTAVVGMASAEPMRNNDGAGAVIPGGCFLSYLYVDPDRWGEGIGGLILDAVLTDAKGRNHSQIRLWTHEDNVRSHRLYRSRGFFPTGRIAGGEGEWAREITREPPGRGSGFRGGHSRTGAGDTSDAPRISTRPAT